MPTYRIERTALLCAVIDAPNEAAAREIGEHMGTDQFNLIEDSTAIFEQVGG